MKELLQEFISHILTEVESASSKEAKRMGLKNISGAYWSQSGQSPATHKSVGDKIVPVGKDDQPKPSGGKKSDSERPSTPSAAGAKKGKPSAKATSPKKQQSPEAERALKSLSSVRRGAGKEGSDFLNALESGNPKTVKALIDKLGITISPEGKIKAKNVPGGRTAEKILGNSKNVAMHINSLLTSMKLPALTISAPEKLPPEDSSQIPSSDAEVFKPSTMFSDRPEVSVSVGPNDVKIGEAQYITLDNFEPGSERRNSLLIEQEHIQEIKNRYPDLSEEEMERKADDINGILSTHNARVRFLQAAIQRGEKFRDLGSGTEAVKLISDKLSSTLKSIVPSSEQKKLQSALDVMASAKNIEEFDNAWKEVNSTLTNSNLPKGSVPLICEHLTAMRSAVNGQSIMLPESDSFKLGDLISYSPAGVTSSDIRAIVNGVQLIEVGIDIGSVKRDAGAASTVGSRITTTTFAGEGVEDTLTILGRGPTKTDPGSMGEIYSATTPAELKKVKEKIAGAIMGRITDVRSYYKIPDSMSDEQVLEGLMTGNAPVYDKKGNFVKFGPEAPQFKMKNKGKGISPINREQLRLYSLSGYAFDAIYNTNATGQAFSNTTFKREKILVSDGIAVMGRSRFQFNKKMSFRKNGVLRDDGIAAKIEPVPRGRMRTYGN